MLFPGIFQEHPERKDVMLFLYKQRELSENLCERLRNDNIYHESYDPVEGDSRYIIAVYRRDFRKVESLHYKVLAGRKQRFISDPVLRTTVLVIFLVAIGLAVAGLVIKGDASP